MRTLTVLTLTATIALAGCSSGDAPTEAPVAEAPTDGDSEAAASVASDGTLTFRGTDDVAWEEAMRSTAAGTVQLTLECGAGVGHGLAIEGVQGGEELAVCDAGGSDTATAELEAGEYTYFCTVPGHREAGMEGTLTVG